MLECVELTLLSRAGSAPGAEWRRGLLIYGQPYGTPPYGRFSDHSVFSYFSKFFVVFWFQEIFSKKNFREKIFGERHKNFSKKKIGEIEKIDEKKLKKYLHLNKKKFGEKTFTT